MKKVISAALIAAAVAQPALAHDAREDVERKDVAQAQADADNMGAIEATWLKARVIATEAILADLRLNQSLMDKVGAEHTRNVRTIPLGLTRSALTAALGAASIYYMSAPEYLQFDKEISEAYSVIAGKRKDLKAKQAELKTLTAKADPSTTAREATLLEETGTLKKAIDDSVTNIKITESKRFVGRRAWSKSRAILGWGIGLTLFADSALSLGQLVIDPAFGDDVEAQLTKFVDDANDTLARR